MCHYIKMINRKRLSEYQKTNFVFLCRLHSIEKDLNNFLNVCSYACVDEHQECFLLFWNITSEFNVLLSQIFMSF